MNLFHENMTVEELRRHPFFSGNNCDPFPVSGEMEAKFKGPDAIPLELNEERTQALNDLIRLEAAGIKVIRQYSNERYAQCFYLPAGILEEAPDSPRPFALVCAGGSYHLVASVLEAFPVARELNRRGITAFVVHYKVDDRNLLPQPTKDLGNALRYVLHHTNEFQIIPEDYLVVGFSAAGHLVGEFGTSHLGYKKQNLPKPGTLVLGYPLLSFHIAEPFGPETGRRLVTKEISEKDIEVAENVDSDYPPVYIWHCADDPEVPIENSRRLAAAVKEAGVPVLFREIGCGGHGLGSGTGSEAEGWIDEAVGFWKGKKYEKGSLRNSSAHLLR